MKQLKQIGIKITREVHIAIHERKNAERQTENMLLGSIREWTGLGVTSPREQYLQITVGVVACDISIIHAWHAHTPSYRLTSVRWFMFISSQNHIHVHLMRILLQYVNELVPTCSAIIRILIDSCYFNDERSSTLTIPVDRSQHNIVKPPLMQSYSRVDRFIWIRGWWVA